MNKFSRLYALSLEQFLSFCHKHEAYHLSSPQTAQSQQGDYKAPHTILKDFINIMLSHINVP